jgi:hypothetical protein
MEEIREKNGMFGIFKIKDNQTKFLFQNDWYILVKQTEETDKIAYYFASYQEANQALNYYKNVIEVLENI